MFKIRYLLLLAVLLCAFGCSKSGGAAYSEAGVTQFERARTPGLVYREAPSQGWEGAGYYAEEMESRDYGVVKTFASNETPIGENVERKLVKQANIRIRTENLDTAEASITSLMEKHGAYAASTQAQENSSLYYSIRVPSSEYDAFLAGMNGIGRILNRIENTEDVTLRYYDLEGRLATKKELLKTFQSYLGKAKNIEEILSVETRLADLQNEIDGTGRELRNLANRVDYATVDLTLLGPVTVSSDKRVTLGERFKGIFAAFGGFLSTLALVLVGIVIYGVPILLLLVLFFWLFFGKIGLVKKLWRVAAGKK